jgi:hypothetical protein
MAPRRSAPVRSTQKVKTEKSTLLQAEAEGELSASPDPIALTPAPTARPQRTRARASESSPAPSSTQAPSSELRTGSGGRKTRLRSGRRSKGLAVTEDVLGDEDLVVPSDEEEFEVWLEEKEKGERDDRKGESSKMAQDRWAMLEKVRTQFPDVSKC